MKSFREFLQIGAVAVGIDIGRSAIKVVELKRTARGIALQRWGIAATPSGAVEAGVILDRKAVAGAVDGLLRQTGVRRRRAVISVTGQNVLARVLRMPPIPEDEVKQAIKWEAERHLPFPVDDAVLDAQIVGEVTEEGQPQIEVLLAAAPEGLVLAYIETLDAARVFVDAVEVGALAMARGLQSVAAQGTLAMINLGASTTDVAVVRRGIPQFTRTVLSGQDAMAYAPEPEAGSAGASGGTGPPVPEGEAYTPMMTVALDELITQLRRSLDFYRAQFGGATIDGMVLCGGGARVPGIDRRFSQELELPVSVGTPFGVVEAASGIDATALAGAAAQLVVAAGLALRMVA